MRTRSIVCAALLALAAACGGGSKNDEDGADVAEVPDDGGGGEDVVADDPAVPDDGPGDDGVVPCSTPLAARVRVTAVSVSPSSVEVTGGGFFSPFKPVILSPAADGTSRVAWTDGTGTVHVTPLDAADARRGQDATLDGEEVRGFVDLGDGAAVLVRRGDVMALVRLSDAGAEAFTLDIVGGTSHEVEGARWIDDWSHEGRLAWSGSQFAAYFGQTGNHGSAGNHQGDRLTLVDPAGALASGGWDWGCSHSLDVRLAWNGAMFGPVCLSDCYPGKGIYFNHSSLVREEPSGDCSGFSDASLGGLVPASDGFWLSFTSGEGRGSSDVGLVRIAPDGTPGSPVFITDTSGTDETGAHLARYGENFLAGWIEGAAHVLTVVSASGGAVEGPVPIDAQFAEKDDFITWPGGDVGWAYAWGDMTQLRIVRVSLCE